MRRVEAAKDRGALILAGTDKGDAHAIVLQNLRLIVVGAVPPRWPAKRFAGAPVHARQQYSRGTKFSEGIFMMGHRPGRLEQVSPGGGDAEQDVDPAAILARFDGNVRLLEELVTIFMEECPKQMEEIRDAITRKDASGLRYSAHQLRGSVGNFGTFAAYERARQLEQMARMGDLGSAADIYAVLQKAILRFQQVLSQLVSERGMVSRPVVNIVKSQALQGPRKHDTLANRQQINP